MKMTNECLESLINYNWPGNVRELENTLEGMVALAETEVLTFNNLPLRIQALNETVNKMFQPVVNTKLDDYNLKNKEYQTIINAIKKNYGHRQKSAEELGISRRTLQYKLKKMKEDGIDL